MKNILAEIFGNKKERTDFLIAIFVILIFIGSVVYYIFRPKNTIYASTQTNVTYVDSKNDVLVKKKLDELAQDVNVEEQSVAEESDSKSFFDKIKERKNNVAKSAAAAVNPDNSNEIEAETIEEELTPEVETIPDEEVQEEENANPELEAPTTTQTEDKLQQTDENLILTDSLSETADQNTTTEDTKTPALESDSSAPPKYNVSPRANKMTDDTEAPPNAMESKKYGCIIIVGAFKERKNADTLQAILKRKAYPVYRGINNGYYVVGVNTDCDKKTAVPLLNKIKKEFQTAAWIYKR